MREYYPVLVIAGILGLLSAAFLFAYFSIRGKKEEIGFDRHMKDSELIRRLLRYAKPYWKKYILIFALMMVAALFDMDPAHPAQSTASVPAYPESELEARLPDLDAQIAVLALPAAKAQEMLSRLRDLGIRAIWNISPVDLHPPRDMAVANWHLHDTLQILSYRINRMEEELSRR